MEHVYEQDMLYNTSLTVVSCARGSVKSFGILG